MPFTDDEANDLISKYRTIIDAAQQSPGALVMARMELAGRDVAVVCSRVTLVSGKGEDLLPLAVIVDDAMLGSLTMNGQAPLGQSPNDYSPEFPDD